MLREKTKVKGKIWNFHWKYRFVNGVLYRVNWLVNRVWIESFFMLSGDVSSICSVDLWKCSRMTYEISFLIGIQFFKKIRKKNMVKSEDTTFNDRIFQTSIFKHSFSLFKIKAANKKNEQFFIFIAQLNPKIILRWIFFTNIIFLIDKRSIYLLIWKNAKDRKFKKKKKKKLQQQSYRTISTSR